MTRISLPKAPANYDETYLNGLIAKIEAAIANCHQKGEDIVVGQGKDAAGGLVSRRLILRDIDDGVQQNLHLEAGVITVIPA